MSRSVRRLVRGQAAQDLRGFRPPLQIDESAGLVHLGLPVVRGLGQIFFQAVQGRFRLSQPEEQAALLPEEFRA